MKFAPEFFREEERSGYIVPEMMKRAWAAATEVLEAIADVCARNGLTYYAYFGTLLGSIRHGGFIPWDDDIDIAMPRADYDRFMAIAATELPPGFVVSGIYAAERRLIDANWETQGRVIVDEQQVVLTDYMTRFHAYPYPRIGVDIFPLDYLPEDPAEQDRLIRYLTDLNSTAMYLDEYRANGTLEERLRHFAPQLEGLTYDPADDLELKHALMYAADRIAAAVPPTGRVACTTYLIPAKYREGEGYPGYAPEAIAQGMDSPFEYGTVRIPTGYDEVLQALYGPDYLTPLQFTAGHDYPFYRNQEAEFARMLAQSGITDSVDEFCRKWHRMNGMN